MHGTHRDGILVEHDVVGEACRAEKSASHHGAWHAPDRMHVRRQTCCKHWQRHNTQSRPTSVVGPRHGLASLDGHGVRVEHQAAGVGAKLHVGGVRRQRQTQGGDGHTCRAPPGISAPQLDVGMPQDLTRRLPRRAICPRFWIASCGCTRGRCGAVSVAWRWAAISAAASDAAGSIRPPSRSFG